MGLLAETKTRRRINHDPNNTKWTRDETTFGQKILRSQGWQPGEFLGAKDAPHSELHTAASASYIRVSLKDDMKGLGFDRAKDNEISGLDAFTDLLSRLNGKSAASVQEDQQARMVVKLNRYVEQKYGPMRFVRGGLLVGDELKEEEKEEEEKTDEASVQKEEEAAQEAQKSKKRKASSQSSDEADASDKDSESKSKKRRKDGDKKSKKKSSEDSDESEAARKEKKRSKKDKSRQQSAATSADESEAPEQASRRKSAKDSSADDDEDSAKESKQSKKERKEEKRARKELKKQEKKEKKERKEEKKRRKLESRSGSDREKSSSATPAGSGTSTPRNPHLVRSRFLKAKREAMLNENSINKIFMVKA